MRVRNGKDGGVLSLSHRLNRLFATCHSVDEFELSNEDAATLLSERLGRTVDATELSRARNRESSEAEPTTPLARDVRHELCTLFGMTPDYLSLEHEIDADTAVLITQLDTELRGLCLYRDHQVEQFRACSPGSTTTLTAEDKLTALIVALEAAPAPKLHPTRMHYLAPDKSASAKPIDTLADHAPSKSDLSSEAPKPGRPTTRALRRVLTWFRRRH